MDDPLNFNQYPQRPKRRKRTRQDIFKEVYLPGIIACVTMLLIIIFIIGSITRAIQHSRYDKAVAKQEALAAQQIRDALDKEAAQISATATTFADKFDYRTAINLLNSFSGDLSEYPELTDKIAKYEEAEQNLILWDDPNSVVSLSFHILIADGEKAFSNPTYGTKYRSNFITTTEFRNILLELYKNNYILVSLSDVSNPDGMQLYLPAGKKPLLLTQTNVNYYQYMIDSNGDHLADAGGAGFASRLILDANGNISCEMIASDGQAVNGQYDMVPILESFIETHPDFSYRNAKAVLAVTGYDGIFGYRTNASAAEYLDATAYMQEVEGAKSISNKLRDLGYELACYTYDNIAYGNNAAEKVKSDLTLWANEVTPILGNTNILVYAQNSDISGKNAPYSGEKFNILSANGFSCFLGFCSKNENWCYQNVEYTRIGRIQITGSDLTGNKSLYEGIFDAAAVIDPAR